MFDKYTRLFSGMRTDRGGDRYPAITNHRAPHKPFLPLSVMDLIAEGQIIKNFIEPYCELVDTFNGYLGQRCFIVDLLVAAGLLLLLPLPHDLPGGIERIPIAREINEVFPGFAVEDQVEDLLAPSQQW